MSVQVVSFLLDCNFPVSDRNADKETPLHISAMKVAQLPSSHFLKNLKGQRHEIVDHLVKKLYHGRKQAKTISRTLPISAMFFSNKNFVST